MRIQLHTHCRKLRICKLDFERGLGILVLPVALVISNTSKEQERAPEDEHVVQQLGIDVDRQPAPVRRFRVVERQVRENEHPQHLLREADDDTERQKDSKYRLDVRALNLRTEKSPEQPANRSPNQKLKCPALEEDHWMDVIAHVAKAHPFLKREEETDQNRSGNKDCRLHKHRFVLARSPHTVLKNTSLLFVPYETTSIEGAADALQAVRLRTADQRSGMNIVFRVAQRKSGVTAFTVVQVHELEMLAVFLGPVGRPQIELLNLLPAQYRFQASDVVLHQRNGGVAALQDSSTEVIIGLLVVFFHSTPIASQNSEYDGRLPEPIRCSFFQ